MRKTAGAFGEWKRWLSITTVTLVALLVLLNVTNTAEAETSLSIEAEGMSGSGKVFSDKTASNRKARAFYKNQRASRQVTGSFGSVAVRAKGELCKGAPRMAVAVDGKIVMSRLVKTQSKWGNYSVKVNVPSGKHTITAKFTNNRETRNCDRNLRVDKVNLVSMSTKSSPVDSNESGEITYGPPITITQGGTYSGNWKSLDPDTPAVRVNTSEPVVIQNSTIRSGGDLIKAVGPSNVTVRDTRGYGLNPNEVGRFPGRFFNASGFANVVLENNYFEGTSGINLYDYSGNGTSNQTVKVLRNSAKNIDGRYSDGNSGFSPSGFHRVQFVQLNKVKDVTNAEIAWNQIVNEPGKSRVEDNISVYRSTGTQGNPILIHDNYVQGAYPTRPTVDGYSGGGIITDGSTCTLADATAFVRIFNNQVVSTSNYGIAIYSGHDNEIYSNRVISSGYLPDGSYIAAQNVGIYVADMTDNRDCGTWYNNHAHDNTIGWVNKKSRYDYSDYRNDMWFPVDGSDYARNTSLPNLILRDTEAEELTRWQTKVASASVVFGPRN